ncbi:Fur-regulated basic protein FbpA [Bacillus sporothermodurans]|uniref:Fur-regulated basic protein FbpA n=1 Tax=Heyndrickxia sporothermodurans TaxID=46224 RepID=A0AB37HFG6_9BACI|nr:Fur-regulated basic protein FbpA [Heyndrickxia sporothermodurans]MBL5772456.1 Fur-regulated basic protein FbpA [Heyndrickxia sporothermodurans]MBL5774809.1 Fur-regulated basic protein FbpA [Heyndrickxia sporothermodurans]MBL5792733.1 Fur-regulated basic protein FbpA [Heyndrickxia sporothermodurans]MBL5796115.1 Fur-regulated basic protein FbpA [Heyndrickxia sporothermodurans]MBL5807022.1 Fur-regulated basic protein FbpA [Heyndrickxia sporothermodurans]
MSCDTEYLKKFYIDQLLSIGIYKSLNKQLYELTLEDLEEIYNESQLNSLG